MAETFRLYYDHAKMPSVLLPPPFWQRTLFVSGRIHTRSGLPALEVKTTHVPGRSTLRKSGRTEAIRICRPDVFHRQ